MPNAIQALSEALQRDMDALNDIAQNISNVNTPGYKGVSQTFAMEMQQGVTATGETVSVNNNVQVKQILDLSNGSLKQTNKALDVAITGNAFFVHEANGEILLSRNGSMRLNQTGVLLGPHGVPMMGQNGPINLQDLTSITIDKQGTIKTNGETVDQLRLMSVVDNAQMRTVGSGLYQTAKENLTTDTKHVVHQGFLESSNVDSTQEMVRMMELSKHFESVQKALSIYDQAINSGITKTGK